MIIVLGGAGFVGSAFARRCRDQGIEHAVVTRQNYGKMAGTACDTLVDASGNSSKLLGRSDPAADLERSVLNVRRALADFEFSRYVLLSSCDVYPDCSAPSATAEDRDLDPRRQSVYGLHKRMAEMCVANACGDWIVLRLGGMVGPGLRKNPVYDIMHGGPLWVHPDSRLQFMETDEVARIGLHLAGHGGAAGAGPRNQVYNVCGTGTVRLGDLPGCGAVEVREGAPAVTYDVNTDKIRGLVRVPESAGAVASFMGGPA